MTAAPAAPAVTAVTAADTTAGRVHECLARLAGVVEDTLAAITAADGTQVGMPTAGAVIAATDRLAAAAVEVLSKVTDRGVIADEGLSIAAWLHAPGGRTTADERTYTLAAQRLADMPRLRGMFLDGSVNWSTVRGIVLGLRHLTAAQRAWVDATLTGDPDRVRAMDADELVAAAGLLADRARPDLHRTRASRAIHNEHFQIHLQLDGSSTGTFQFGPETTANLLTLVNTAPPPPSAPTATATTTDEDATATDTATDATASAAPAVPAAGITDPDSDQASGHGDTATDADGTDDGGGWEGWTRRRGWTNAQKVAAAFRVRAGTAGTPAPSPARPALLAIVDLAAIRGETGPDHQTTAQLLLQSPRGPIELTPSAAQRLLCDATVHPILVDGPQILGAAAAHPKISATLRHAVYTRDGSCRFPGCRHPVELCELHHLTPIADGGPTTLDNLAAICLAHHHAIHDSGWTNHPHPDGTITFTRRGTTLTSLPRHHQRPTPTTPPPPGRPTRPRTTTKGTHPDQTTTSTHTRTVTPAPDQPPPRAGAPPPPPLPF